MKEIKLHGKHGEGKFALVDDEDYPYLSQFSWRVDNKGYIKRTLNIYDNGNHQIKVILMHREIMKVTDPKIFVDHKFHNLMDNRKEMLRVCNNQQNSINRRKKTGTSSKYIGVSFDKQSNYWRSAITYKSKKI